MFLFFAIGAVIWASLGYTGLKMFDKYLDYQFGKDNTPDNGIYAVFGSMLLGLFSIWITYRLVYKYHTSDN